VAATLALHLGLLAGYVLAFAGDVSCLVCADRELLGRWPYEAVGVGFEAHGFDGQYYYVLARDPWHCRKAFLDVPAYRHSRILYPAFAWLLSGGDPTTLLWVLPAINLLAIAGLAWLGVRLAVRYGGSPWWGFLLPLVVNAGMAALRNLTDPLATLTAAGLLTAWLLRWPAWSLAAWAVAAVLSREQNAVIVLIVLLGALSGRRRRAAVGLAGALLVWVGWLVTLRVSYGTWPFLSVNTGPPLAGLCYRLTHPAGVVSGPRAAAVHVLLLLHLLLQMGLCLALPFCGAGRTVTLVALAGAALAGVAGASIYENGWSYTRVFVWMPLALWLWGVQSGRRWPALALAPAVLCPVLALGQAWTMRP
jgi:hypothetical protein